MQPEMPTVAFYYGFQLPGEISQAYDQVVVQPAHVKPSSEDGRSQIIAYVSLGEVAGDDRKGIDKDWVLGTNPKWNSSILDIRNPGFQKHFLESRILPLADQGYAGVFLDTLDSPLIYLKSESEQEQYRRALNKIMNEIHRRAPRFHVIINRGFEVLDDIAHQVDAVAAESLFSTWDGQSKQYRETPASDQEWLLNKLEHAKNDLGLQVIVIDYVDPKKPEDADRVRRRIASHGFTPWVADWQLQTPGFGAVDLIPRRVMILRDGAADFGEQDRPFRYLSLVLEQMGFVPVYENLSSNPLPKLDGLYAGLIVWATGDKEIPGGLKALIREQVEAELPVLLLGDLHALASGNLTEPLSLHSEAVFLEPPLVLRASSKELGFEVDPITPVLPVHELRAHRSHDVWLSVRGRNGRRADVVAVTDWGGYAMSSHFLRDIGLGEQRWVVDPFAFLRAALRLPSLPVPSLSTEDGKRILVAEVQVDPGKPVSSNLKKALGGAPFRHELLFRSSGSAATKALKHPSKLFYPAAASPLLPGHTDATLAKSSLTHVWPAGRMTREGVEAYFPTASSEAYGADSAPYAYRRLLETFELTERPCRLSALGIRFGATLADSAGGRRALESIYDWVSQQDVLPLRSREYAERVRDFYELAVVRRLDGRLQVRGAQQLRTYRLPSDLGSLSTNDSSKIHSSVDPSGGGPVSFAQASDIVLSFEQMKVETGPQPSVVPLLTGQTHSLTEAPSCR